MSNPQKRSQFKDLAYLIAAKKSISMLHVDLAFGIAVKAEEPLPDKDLVLLGLLFCLFLRNILLYLIYKVFLYRLRQIRLVVLLDLLDGLLSRVPVHFQEDVLLAELDKLLVLCD
jgi:hypothetical protein